MKRIIALMLVFVMTFALLSICANAEGEKEYFRGMNVDFELGKDVDLTCTIYDKTNSPNGTVRIDAATGAYAMLPMYNKSANQEVLSTNVHLAASNTDIKTLGNFKLELDVRNRGGQKPFDIYGKFVFKDGDGETVTGWQRIATAQNGSTLRGVQVSNPVLEGTATEYYSGAPVASGYYLATGIWHHVELIYNLTENKLEFFVNGTEAEYTAVDGAAIDGVNGYIELPEDLIGLDAVAFGSPWSSSSTSESNGWIDNVRILSTEFIPDDVRNSAGSALAVKYNSEDFNLDDNTDAKVYANGVALDASEYSFAGDTLWFSGDALAAGDNTILINDGTSDVAEFVQTVTANEQSYDFTKGTPVNGETSATKWNDNSSLPFEGGTDTMIYLPIGDGKGYIIWENLPAGVYEVQFYNYRYEGNTDYYYADIVGGEYVKKTVQNLHNNPKDIEPDVKKLDVFANKYGIGSWDSLGIYRLSEDNSVKIYHKKSGTLRAHSIKLIDKSHDLTLFNYGLGDNGKTKLAEAGEATKVKFALHNSSEESKTVVVLAASFDGDKLVGTNKVSVTVPSGDYIDDGLIDTLSLKAGDVTANEVKLFVWDSTDTLTPLDSSVCIK